MLFHECISVTAEQGLHAAPLEKPGRGKYKASQIGGTPEAFK